MSFSFVLPASSRARRLWGISQTKGAPMRHQAIAPWKQSGNFFLAGDLDGVADFTVRTNILMLQADLIL
jgi:hypothetical protein